MPVLHSHKETAQTDAPWPVFYRNLFVYQKFDHMAYIGCRPYAQHAQSYPDLEQPSRFVNIGWLGCSLILSNGGSCFLPERCLEQALLNLVVNGAIIV